MKINKKIGLIFILIGSMVSSEGVMASNLPSGTKMINKQVENRTIESSSQINNDNERKDIEAFTNDFFKNNMEKYHIPGGSVVIVKDGKVILSKGYGYSDVANQKVFDVNETSFRIASITKTFTAAALMQLVGEGKVDLKEEVSSYLPTLKLSNPYPEKVTVGQLLTHTSGIDSSYTGDLSHEVINNDVPHHLVNILNERHLTVVTPPGKFVEYSSYGTVVIGAIVEEVSGISCERYIEEHLLKPLEMDHTSMKLENEYLGKGYLCVDGKLSEMSLDGYFKLYPEGALVSNINDMTHYMQMLLNHGSYQGKMVLKPEILEEMLRQHASFSKELPGMCYGFSEYMNDGVRSVGHAGYSSDGYLSEMDLYPEQEIGTFIVINQGSNNNFQEEFRKAFVKKYLSKSQPDNLNDEQSDQAIEKATTGIQNGSVSMNDETKQIEGTYCFSDYSKTTIYKADAFGGVKEIEIKRLDDHTIELVGTDEYTHEAFCKKAKQIKPLVYEVEGTDEKVVFQNNVQGKVTYMAQSQDSAHGIYEKLKAYETGKVQMLFFVGALVIYLIQLFTALILVIGKLVFKLKGKSKVDAKGLWQQYIDRTISGIALMNVGCFTYAMTAWGDRLRYGVPLDIRINLTMPIISMILTISLFFMEGISVLKEKEKFSVRFYNGLMLTISIIFILFYYYWNFLGYKF